MLLRAPSRDSELLAQFWSRYFREIPACSARGCESIAIDVDPFFPYLDDLNRCHSHRSEPAPGSNGGSVS